MVIEHVVSRGVSLVLKKVLATVGARSSKARMQLAVDELKRELVIRCVTQQELKSALEREQFAPLFEKLFREAVEAATTDRRRLIATAITGLAKYDEGAELQSRVARAVLLLEPSDIGVLKQWMLEAPSASAMRDFRVGKTELDQRFGEAFSANALENALCVHHSASGRVVTALGHAVLKYVGQTEPGVNIGGAGEHAGVSRKAGSRGP